MPNSSSNSEEWLEMVLQRRKKSSKLRLQTWLTARSRVEMAASSCCCTWVQKNSERLLILHHIPLACWWKNLSQRCSTRREYRRWILFITISRTRVNWPLRTPRSNKSLWTCEAASVLQASLVTILIPPQLCQLTSTSERCSNISGARPPYSSSGRDRRQPV